MMSSERFMYLFGCIQDGCGTQPGSWRALRCQLAGNSGGCQQQHAEKVCQAAPLRPVAQTEDTQPQPSDKQQSSAFGEVGSDSWGAGGGADDWGAGGAAAVAVSDDSMDLSDLNAALDALGASQPSGSTGSKRRQQQRSSGSGSGIEAAAQHAAAAARPPPATIGGLPALPAFLLYAEAEDAAAPAQSGGGNGSECEEGTHLQTLLRRYELEEAAAGGGGGALQALAAADDDADDAGSSGAPGGAVCLPETKGGGESWAGEGYEPDAVLLPPAASGRRPGAGGDAPSAQLKFLRRLARCPDQCARYRWARAGQGGWVLADGHDCLQRLKSGGSRRLAWRCFCR